jgi:hypothetical protein
MRKLFCFSIDRLIATFGKMSFVKHDRHAELSVSYLNTLHALHPPTLNPHLTKSRLNDAPRLCEMLHRNYCGASRAGQRSKLPLQRQPSNAAWKGNKVETVWMQGV